MTRPDTIKMGGLHIAVRGAVTVRERDLMLRVAEQAHAQGLRDGYAVGWSQGSRAGIEANPANVAAVAIAGLVQSQSKPKVTRRRIVRDAKTNQITAIEEVEATRGELDAPPSSTLKWT